jgi:hypothetical protein
MKRFNKVKAYEIIDDFKLHVTQVMYFGEKLEMIIMKIGIPIFL